MTRIAVIKKQKCNPLKCGNYLCMRVCPINRTGEQCIIEGSDKKPIIDEKLCTGCGICPNKCPFEAISIINLPEQLKQEPIHRYGKNGFSLYGLPTPIFGKVTGIIGKNGIGKTTALKILANLLKPNMSKETESTTAEVIKYFKGTEAQGYFEKLRDNKIVISYKPQQVDILPRQYDGKVLDLLKKIDEKNKFDEYVEVLELKNILDHKLSELSGGELQRVAIAATVMKKANVFFFDEPTSFLDIKQRLKIAKFIKGLANEEIAVMVIEHDLIILDYVADLVHMMYGREGVYGIVSGVKTTKVGINMYLSGFLKEENLRFRDEAIKFTASLPSENKQEILLTEWNDINYHIGKFNMTAKSGNLYRHDVVGVLGENGIGKTTFVKILAGVIKTKEENEIKLKVSYKSQYVEGSDELVMVALQRAIQKFEIQIMRPLHLKDLLMRKLNELSGGELQRVAIAHCLSQDADLFLMDEPSAYLDVEERLNVSKVIKDVMMATGKSAIIVDHDLLFIDYLSDKLLVFDGEPALEGFVTGPHNMSNGMNKFLSDLNITFRRDDENNRPRVNKEESVKDREQKSSGKLYYG